MDLVKAGSNLRLEKKLLMKDYEAEMLEWTNEPDKSDDEGDDEDGARAEGGARAAAAASAGAAAGESSSVCAHCAAALAG